jgi:hypothetical protein
MFGIIKALKENHKISIAQLYLCSIIINCLLIADVFVINADIILNEINNYIK